MKSDAVSVKCISIKSWKRWIVVFIVVVFVLAPYCYSRLAAKQRRISVSDMGTKIESKVLADEFSILIFNIAHGRGTKSSNFDEGANAKKDRIRKIAQFLKKQDADIVILNEVDFCSVWSGHQNQAEDIARIAGYRYRGEQRNLDFGFLYGKWQFGNAILSKFPIHSFSEIDYPAKSNFESLLAGKKRGAKFCFKRDSEKELNIVPIHLDHRSEELRVQSVSRILEHMESSNIASTILAGDFNSTPTAYPGSSTSTDGENAMNKLVESGMFKTDFHLDDPQPTFPTSNPIRAIDWILIPSSFDLLDYQVIQSDLSDHLPVFAKIRLIQ